MRTRRHDRDGTNRPAPAPALRLSMELRALGATVAMTPHLHVPEALETWTKRLHDAEVMLHEIRDLCSTGEDRDDG